MRLIEKNGVEKPLLSRRKTAALLGVSTKTLFRWERAGRLTAIKINSRVTRYFQDEVERIIADAVIAVRADATITNIT